MQRDTFWVLGMWLFCFMKLLRLVSFFVLSTFLTPLTSVHAFSSLWKKEKASYIFHILMSLFLVCMSSLYRTYIIGKKKLFEVGEKKCEMELIINLDKVWNLHLSWWMALDAHYLWGWNKAEFEAGFLYDKYYCCYYYCFHCHFSPFMFFPFFLAEDDVDSDYNGYDMPSDGVAGLKKVNTLLTLRLSLSRVRCMGNHLNWRDLGASLTLYSLQNQIINYVLLVNFKRIDGSVQEFGLIITINYIVYLIQIWLLPRSIHAS